VFLTLSSHAVAPLAEFGAGLLSDIECICINQRAEALEAAGLRE
jgi:hypothetical protein